MADEKIMTRVMKLLDLAADAGATEHERELAAEQAERLMAKHMIDRMEAEKAARREGRAERKPEKAKWDIRIGFSDNGARQQSNEYGSTIINLAVDVLVHCGIRVHPRAEYPKSEDGRITDFNTRVLTLVGFSEDMSYAEKIWFRVYKEFVTNVSPQWIDGKDKLGENVYNFQKAGFKWEQIWRAAWNYQQKMRESNPHWSYITATGRGREIVDPYHNKYCPTLKASAKEYCASIGEAYTGHTQRHEAYKTSFARSYQSTISQRLRKLRDEAGKGDDGVDSNQFALAIVDTKERVDEEFYRLFPEHDPRVQQRKRDEEAFAAACAFASLPEEEQLRLVEEEAAAREARYQQMLKESKRARRNYGTYRESTTNNIDESAWRRGQSAANRVNLRNDAEVRKEERAPIQSSRRALD